MASWLRIADPSRPSPLQTDREDKAQRLAGVRLKLFVEEAAIGIGQIDLLDFIGQTGSPGIAASQMNIDEARAECLSALT